MKVVTQNSSCEAERDTVVWHWTHFHQIGHHNIELTVAEDLKFILQQRIVPFLILKFLIIAKR
jgi:hypothetical protein